MKTPLKSTLITLSLAIIATFAFAACTGDTGTHNMNQPKPGTSMPNKAMPAAGSTVSTASGTAKKGTHLMNQPKSGTLMPNNAMPGGQR